MQFNKCLLSIIMSCAVLGTDDIDINKAPPQTVPLEYC